MIFIKNELALLHSSMAMLVIFAALISNSLAADDNGGTGGTPKAACLDGSDYVRTPEGPKLISRLSIGDRVAVITIDNDPQNPKGEVELFDSVISFLHRDPEKSAKGYRFTGGNGSISLTLSDDHLIFTAPSMKAILAKNVKIGDRVYIGNHHSRKEVVIEKIDRTRLQGRYSPLTKSGVILVNNVLVSCYSQIEDHPLMHYVTQWLTPMAFSERLFGSQGALANKDGLHWVMGDFLWHARRWFLHSRS